MKMNCLLLTVLSGLVAGCSTPRTKTDVYTYRSDVGKGIDLIMDNELESSSDRQSLVWLNASRVREGDWGGRYYLEVRYEALQYDGWLDIGPGETLTLAIDGETLNLRGPGSVNTRRVTGSGTFVENAIYQTTEDVLRKLAKAKQVHVTIRGKARTIERDFRPENTRKFRNFVLTYIGF
jgi:hypothetical protein